jgi:ATP-binding cassette, subfamily B, bacterial PglK
LDMETEHGIMEAVRGLQGKKTVLIVAHRLSTVEHCQYLYRLDKGEVVEEGKISTVLNKQSRKHRE